MVIFQIQRGDMYVSDSENDDMGHGHFINSTGNMGNIEGPYPQADFQRIFSRIGSTTGQFYP